MSPPFTKVRKPACSNALAGIRNRSPSRDSDGARSDTDERYHADTRERRAPGMGREIWGHRWRELLTTPLGPNALLAGYSQVGTLLELVVPQPVGQNCKVAVPVMQSITQVVMLNASGPTTIQ